MATKQVRILLDTKIDGISYSPNKVVELDEKIAKGLESAGAADADKDAVAYCTTELGAKPLKHADEVAKAAKAAKAAATEESEK